HRTSARLRRGVPRRAVAPQGRRTVSTGRLHGCAAEYRVEPWHPKEGELCPQDVCTAAPRSTASSRGTRGRNLKTAKRTTGLLAEAGCRFRVERPVERG